MNKLVASSLATALACSVALPALAMENGLPPSASPTAQKQMMKRSMPGDRMMKKPDASSFNGQCMSTASDKRDTAMIAAVETHHASVKTALTVRRDAVKAAWLLTDKTQRETALKAAHDAFRTSSQKSRQVFDAARKTAHTAFKTDATSCKVAVPASESSAAGADQKI